MINTIDSSELERLTTRITKRAMALMQFECARRYRAEAARPPFGKIISESLEKMLGHLGPELEKQKQSPQAAGVKRRLPKIA